MGLAIALPMDVYFMTRIQVILQEIIFVLFF